MKYVIIALLCSSFGFSAPKNIWPIKNSPIDGIRDFSFDIETESFVDLVSKKVEASFYWLPTQKELSFKNSFKEKMQNKLQSLLTDKISILTGDKFSNYIKNYKYNGLIKGWHRFEDEFGVQDKSEIWMKKGKKSLKIIEKKSVGTTYINYHFENENNIDVLKTIEHKSFIGLQSFKSTTSIKYGQNGKFYLPVEIQTTTTQKLTTNEDKSPKRNLEENFKFKNYKINKSEALKWFSKR